MRTYRLQFSEDGTVLQRRLEKAKASQALRLIGLGFQHQEPLRDEFSGIWALETDDLKHQSHWIHWDEVHFLLKEPKETAGIRDSKTLFVLQPHRLISRRDWIQWLRQFSPDQLNEKVFIEFEPWSKQMPHLLTVHEISQFLYELKYHFPNWQPRRRSGVELWDNRIPEYFEVEASEWIEHKWNWKCGIPKISVVIPTFNNKFFVYKVIAHLMKQNCSKENFEVIVVDDGGTDQTLDYLKTFGILNKLQLLYVHWPRPHLRNRGDSFFRAGLARNLGVRLSRAENLVFLDSDILVSENFLTTVLESLKMYDVIQFPRFHIHQDKSSSKTQYENVRLEDCYIEEPNYWGPFFQSTSWMSVQKFWKYTCTYALALKKKDFFEAGRFKRFYVSYGFEDTELGYHLAALGKKFHLSSEKVFHLTSYTQSEYQMSAVRRVNLLKRTAKLFFLSTLDLENYHHFFGFMAGDYPWLTRLKKGLYWKDKNKYFDAISTAAASKKEKSF